MNFKPIYLNRLIKADSKLSKQPLLSAAGVVVEATVGADDGAGLAGGVEVTSGRAVGVGYEADVAVEIVDKPVVFGTKGNVAGKTAYVLICC